MLIRPPKPAADPAATGAKPVPSPATGAMVMGSTCAKVLFELYAGAPVIKVDSPPGAGKSTLLADVVAHLWNHTDATIGVGVFTNAQGSAIAQRLGQVLGVDPAGTPRVRVGSARMRHGENVAASHAGRGSRMVEVRTIASGKSRPPELDVLLVDEAYQITFADFAEAADKARQVVVVGDPGQIGPVVPFDAGGWDHMSAAPHHRTPEVLARRRDVSQLRLSGSFRLGPQTVAAIAPLYDFEFTSHRPHRELDGFAGEIRAVQVPVRQAPFDMDTMRTAAQAAKAYIGVALTYTADGQARTRTMEARDVAIVVSRNSQEAALRAILGPLADQITIGTADRLQGGQWHAVVAVDPTLAGAESSHALSAGRLCVMASRHMTHLTWVYDAGWDQVLAGADSDDAHKGALVRQRLLRAGT